MLAENHSLFEIDHELDTLFDDIEDEVENRGEASVELLERFQLFCDAHAEDDEWHPCMIPTREEGEEGGEKAAEQATN